MSASDLKILKEPRRLECRSAWRAVTIRLLTKEAIAKLSPHGYKAYNSKFTDLKVCADLDEDWLWDGKEKETDTAAFKAFDYLRHAIANERRSRNK